MSDPGSIQTAFDGQSLVANAELILPVSLAQRLGLSELVGNHVDLGNAPWRANTGDNIVTLVASALAGGDCIDDADVLRPGGTAGAIGCVIKAPSTLGTFLRSFRWGHVRQLEPGEPGSCWHGPGAAGAGPGDGPLTIDMDLHHPRDLWAWPRRGPATAATPASGAITRCWPSPPAPAMC